MATDIEIAVAEELYMCKTASRILHKENLTAASAVRSLVRDQCCRTGRGVDEEFE